MTTAPMKPSSPEFKERCDRWWWEHVDKPYMEKLMAKKIDPITEEVYYAQSRHEGPCDGMGYKQDCSMCSGFVERFDGTLVHDDGTIFAPVEEINQPSISYRLKIKESSKRW